MKNKWNIFSDIICKYIDSRSENKTKSDFYGTWDTN